MYSNRYTLMCCFSSGILRAAHLVSTGYGLHWRDWRLAWEGLAKGPFLGTDRGETAVESEVEA